MLYFPFCLLFPNGAQILNPVLFLFSMCFQALCFCCLVHSRETTIQFSSSHLDSQEFAWFLCCTLVVLSYQCILLCTGISTYKVVSNCFSGYLRLYDPCNTTNLMLDLNILFATMFFLLTNFLATF